MNPEIKNQLGRMADRAQGLFKLDPARFGNFSDSQEFWSQALNSDVSDADKAQAIIDAWGDKDKQQALNELRVETVNNYIRATSNFASLFFQEVSLGESDRPVIQNETSREIDISYLAQDGRERTVKAVAPQTETMVDLRFLNSDSYGYRVQDIYSGNVTQAALRTVDIAFDLQNKIDAEAKTLLDGALGSFTLTGNKQDRVYVANSRISTGNLPTTNDVTASGTSSSTKFRLEVIRTIMKYCDQWGNAFADGPLRPTGVILVPSIDATDLASEITPDGSTSNAVADGVLSNYSSFTYMGVNWTLVPDVTLTSGKCYPVLNKPVGNLYSKPSMNQEFVETDNRKNWEERSQRVVFGSAIPSPRKVNALRVTYKS